MILRTVLIVRNSVTDVEKYPQIDFSCKVYSGIFLRLLKKKSQNISIPNMQHILK